MSSFQSSSVLTKQKPKVALPLEYIIKHYPIKRIFDMIFSFSVMVIGSPVFALLCLAVKLSSKGPIFYSHERIGRGGVAFPCYKFRTMFTDADARLHDILASDLAKNKEWQETQKLKNDPRIAPIGAFLRKTSLDELPQVVNVLLGQASVVGPRAMVKKEIETHIGPKAAKILSVRPGITGLWQTSGRSNLSFKERIALDEKYVENHNFFLDLKLILKTIPVMLFSKGAY
jgi:exopolysaccharide production protein ExoY